VARGAPREQIKVWGVPLAAGFSAPYSRHEARVEVCRWLGLEPDRPVVLVSGGSEGLGRIETAVARLLRLDSVKPQVIVLAGRNERLRRRCSEMAPNSVGDLRVLGWTERMPELMHAADLQVSKLGVTFIECVAAALPLVALQPPPGAEQIQHRLVDQWKVGRAVRSFDEMAGAVARLLASPGELDAMRERAQAHRLTGAATRIAHWIAAAPGRQISPEVLDEREAVAV
jgi:processive 1,2-diacylglycerol beta-glucosyltransferase